MKFFFYICNCVALDTGMCAEKKFAESLVVSKSRCTFALATQKNGSSEVSGEP